MAVALDSAEAGDASWTERFHQGEQRLIGELYTEHFDTVAYAIGTILNGADRENVIHDVFVSIMESRAVRESFTGGSVSAWLRRIARNRAIDFYRRQRRGTQIAEQLHDESDIPQENPQTQAETAMVDKLVARFKAEVLPEKWHAVFDACFIKQLSQRDAAKVLGISRTTLAYQEMRIRAALKKFMLHTDAGSVS